MVLNERAIIDHNKNNPEQRVGMEDPRAFFLDPVPGVFTPLKTLPELAAVFSRDDTFKVRPVGRRGQWTGLRVTQTLPERHVPSPEGGEPVKFGKVKIEKVYDADGKIIDTFVSRNTGVPYTHTHYEYETFPSANPTAPQQWVLTKEVTTAKAQARAKNEVQVSHGYYTYDNAGNLIGKPDIGGDVLRLELRQTLDPEVDKPFTPGTFVHVEDFLRNLERRVEGRPDIKVIRGKRPEDPVVVRVFPLGKSELFPPALHYAYQNDYVIRNGRTEVLRVYRGYAGESEFSFGYNRYGQYSGRELVYTYDANGVCISETDRNLPSGSFARR